jgi:starvation-inducible outer membrane lipoprotein
MTFWKQLFIAGMIFQTFTMTACNAYRVIPTQYESQVNQDLTYKDARNHMANTIGQMVVWGGEVLKSTRFPNETCIEVLQLPLNDDWIPAGERTESSGRFLAVDTKGEIIDPAVIPEGARVTIVGRVREPGSAFSDPGSQDDPVISIRDMTVWEKKVSRAWPYSYYGPYYGHYYYGSRPYVFWDGTRVPGS